MTRFTNQPLAWFGSIIVAAAAGCYVGIRATSDEQPSEDLPCAPGRGDVTIHGFGQAGSPGLPGPPSPPGAAGANCITPAAREITARAEIEPQNADKLREHLR